MTIHATLDVQIDHRSGPPIADPEHVIRWTCAENMWVDGTRDGFEFSVCTGHADPDECPDQCGQIFAIYRATIVSADLTTPVPAR